MAQNHEEQPGAEHDESEPSMIGLERILLMGDHDRAQEIWDRAMTPEAEEHMRKLAEFKAGKGPDLGRYKGPPVDFEKAAQELEEEEPQWNDRAQYFWEQENRERAAQGLPPPPHPLAEEED